MKSHPLVSVVIPVYNVEKYLDICVKSVVEQSYSNLEIILVNDKSLDRSGELCDLWAQKDDRIKVVHKPVNEGLNMARATGFEHSTGSYITFLDSDDLFHPNNIEQSLAAINEYTADAVVYAFGEFSDGTEDDAVHGSSLTPSETRLLTGRDQIGRYTMLGEQNFPSTHHMTVWGKMYSRALVEGVDWVASNYRINEDNFWTPQALLAAKKVVLLSNKMIFYRRNASYDAANGDVLSTRLDGNTFNGEPVGYLEFIDRLEEFYKGLIKEYRIAGADDGLRRVMFDTKLWRTKRLSDAGLLGGENNLDHASGMGKMVKVSVIIPVYNTEAYVSGCLESIFNQTHKNVEVIVVNDASRGNIVDIVAEHQKTHDAIRLVNLKRNSGSYRARLEGVKSATGQYIVCVDPDDTISLDYIRLLLDKALDNNADIVMAETVIEEGAKRYIQNIANDLPFDSISGEQCFSEFMKQQGENYIWYTLHSKMYSRRVWNAALPYLEKINDHIVMTEDILQNIHLWYFANRVERARNAYYVYRKVPNSATQVTQLKSIKKGIADVTKVFSYASHFLHQQKVAGTYRSNINNWKNLYAKIWHDKVESELKEGSVKSALIGSIAAIAQSSRYQKVPHSEFYKLQTNFNDALDNDIKRRIISPSVHYVSFDVFDTLVVRPFSHPTHIFHLMDRHFEGLLREPRIVSFAEIRVKSEAAARLRHKHQEDVTLEQIYKTMQKEFAVEKEVAGAMQALEIEYETKYCTQRRTAKELYDLARYTGKRIIITSDMYLPKYVVERILKNAGYEDYEKLYISSETGLTKYSGTAYAAIAKDLSVDAGSILHIGDSYDSDYTSAMNRGLQATMLPKTIEAMNSHSEYLGAPVLDRVFGGQTAAAFYHTGITALAALVANKFFDNPFVSFSKDSDFNGSPGFMGYFALGMEMYGVAKWIDDEVSKGKIDNLVFLARDGYLPLKAYTALRDALGSSSVNTHYLPTSRKAIAPLSLFDEASIADLSSFHFADSQLRILVESMGDIIVQDGVSKKGRRAGRRFDLSTQTLDLGKAKLLQDAFRKTYGPIFSDRVAVFDIGYSGKPEWIFSRLFNKPVKTLFMYANSDESRRRLGDNLSVFGRFQTLGIRELMISDPAPSCVRYALTSDGGVQPVFEESRQRPYYEDFTFTFMQNSAEQFVRDVVAVFSDHLEDLHFADNLLISAPVNALIDSPMLFDRQIFKGLGHEDDMGLGKTVDIYDINYNYEVHQHTNTPTPLRGLYRAARYDRRVLKDEVYEISPVGARLLRVPYRAARRMVRLVRKGKKL